MPRGGDLAIEMLVLDVQPVSNALGMAVPRMNLPEMRPPSRPEDCDATVTRPDRFRECYNDLRGSTLVTRAPLNA